jgi:hypothetical protein
MDHQAQLGEAALGNRGAGLRRSADRPRRCRSSRVGFDFTYLDQSVVEASPVAVTPNFPPGSKIECRRASDQDGVVLRGVNVGRLGMDTYSKVVLTAIAVALSALVLQNAHVLSTKGASLIPSALADPSEDGRKVQICSWNNTMGEWDCARVQQGRLIVKSD